MQQVARQRAARMTIGDSPMLTLITCSSYSEALDAYRYRVVVQAVLASVE